MVQKTSDCHLLHSVHIIASCLYSPDSIAQEDCAVVEEVEHILGYLPNICSTSSTTSEFKVIISPNSNHTMDREIGLY